MEHTTDEAAEHAGSERIRRIHDRVRKVRNSEEVGVKYMQAWEEKYYEKEEARKEGMQEGFQEGLQKGLQKGLKDLVKKKLERGKSVEEIADALEENEDMILELIKELEV
ncbi:hypothetical protein [Extibacter muris]|uniref:hypothetical protein n=1 Tax=Extibacter muris TaxID=1796622 RepID=UPI0029CA3688|nr:hypothetical protein [Extibacter muris]